MTIRLRKCGTNEVVRHNFIHPSVWGDLAAGRAPSLDYNGYNDVRDLRIEPSPTPSWFFLVLDNVSVEPGDEMYFTLDDRANVFWKSGKSWDFLEIRKVS